jgi:hypothetical protein
MNFGVYRIERQLTETFKASCPRCGWLGESRTNLAHVIADLKAHVDKGITEGREHDSMPGNFSYL